MNPEKINPPLMNNWNELCSQSKSTIIMVENKNEIKEQKRGYVFKSIWEKDHLSYSCHESHSRKLVAKSMISC